MPDVTFTFTADELSRLISAIVAESPVPEDPSTGDPLYTESAWAKVRMLGIMGEIVRRVERKALLAGVDERIQPWNPTP